jgi:drug/metabolite transporter (DMT)-like permease
VNYAEYYRGRVEETGRFVRHNVSFGIIAFGAYITLIRRIGAGRAAYTGVLYPLVALGISTVWEGYHWTPSALAGMAFCVTGSLIMNRR